MKKLFFLFFCTVFFTNLFSCNKKKSIDYPEFRINNGADPQSLDPTKIQGIVENRIYSALFEGLVTYDPKTCEPRPGLAESWKRSGINNEILTFYLRKTTWSDGTPITAKTVRDSWLYYLSPETNAEYAYMPAGIIKGAYEFNSGVADKDEVEIRAIDDYTLEVILTGQVPYAESMFAHFSFCVLPLHTIEKYGNEWTRVNNFVGNGPFILQYWRQDEELAVVPNPKYWNKENIFLSRISFIPISSEEATYNLYKNGDVDWSIEIPTTKIDEVKQMPDYHVRPQLASSYYIFNIQDPILKDVRIRKALAMAIDKDTLVKEIIKGEQIPTDAFCPPMNGYEPPKGNSFNISEAKRLLAEAGYPDGKGFPALTVLFDTKELNKRIANFIQQQWKENLGIAIFLETKDWAPFMKDRLSNCFQIARGGWIGDYADPSNFLELCLSSSGNNDGRYINSDYDALLKKAATMPYTQERLDILKEAEELLIEKDQVLIPLYYYVSQDLIDLNKWDGWYPNELDVHPYVGIKLKEQEKK